MGVTTTKLSFIFIFQVYTLLIYNSYKQILFFVNTIIDIFPINRYSQLCLNITLKKYSWKLQIGFILSIDKRTICYIDNIWS